MNKTREMLEYILEMAESEAQSRVQENKIWENYDIKASEENVEMLREFIKTGYIKLLNSLHYAIIELREWNPESEAAAKLEEILKSF